MVLICKISIQYLPPLACHQMQGYDTRLPLMCMSQSRVYLGHVHCIIMTRVSVTSVLRMNKNDRRIVQ